MIGLSRYAMIDLDYRNQKTGGDFNLSSGFVSVTYPFLNASTGRPWSGVGLSALDDRSAGIFRIQEFSGSYAINVEVAKRQLLSFGAKAQYQSQQINYDGFVTGSQYIPGRGFDEEMPNGENLAALRKSLYTFSVGVYWQKTDRKENMLSYWGISLFDLNQPKSSFFNDDAKVPLTATFNGGIQVYSKQRLSIIPEILYTLSASNHVLNGGARFRYALSTQKNPDKVDIIAKYVVNRSGILGIQLHRENFSAGMSYDFPLFKRNDGNLGALELGLELRKLVIPPARRKSAKRKTSKNNVVARKPVVKKTPIAKKSTNTSDSLNTKGLPKDATLLSVTKKGEIEIDSIKITTDAKAGRLKQEPLLIEKITLHFNFDYNSAEVDDETEDFLKDLAISLAENTNLKLKITGHTDNIGSHKLNDKLSLKRADAVKKYFTDKGIDTSRIVTDGQGMNVPVTGNDTEEGRAKNRRVEVFIFEE